MDAVKANTLSFAIKNIKSELEFNPTEPVITITLRRSDLKDITAIAENEVNKIGGATVDI